jgi:hypothetical protein
MDHRVKPGGDVESMSLLIADRDDSRACAARAHELAPQRRTHLNKTIPARQDLSHQDLPRNDSERRFIAEVKKLQRAYCDLFKMWRDCRYKLCRRYRSCRGDAGPCLMRAAKDMPRQQQWDARQQVLAALPQNAPRVERIARQMTLGELCLPCPAIAGADE